jgi:hypothetical protein
MPFPIMQDMECDHCGQPIKFGQRCIERLRGVAGLGTMSGQPMIVDDPVDPEPIMRLHEWCEEEVWEAQFTPDELLKFCAGCGCKIDPNED